MSAITDVGPSLQSLLRPPQFSPPAGGVRPQGSSDFRGQLQSFVQQAGYDSSQIANVKDDLSSAIEQVKNGGVDDPRGFIESTLRESLEANGIDADQLRADLQPLFESSGFGGAQGFQGLPGFGSSTGVAGNQADLLNQLFGEDEDDESALGDLASLLNSRLPSGTFVNFTA